MDYATTYLILASVIGWFMAFGVGANDVANAIGPAVGSKSMTIKQAIIIAALFEAAGAMLVGGEVTHTVRSEILYSHLLQNQPELIIYGMMAASLSAGAWLLIASFKGWPVSTTHSIVGAIIGFGAVHFGRTAVHWGKVFSIMGSWILTPLIAGVIAFLLFSSVKNKVLNRKHPMYHAKWYVPGYVGLGSLILSLVTLVKGLKRVGIKMTLLNQLGFSIMISLLMMFITWLVLIYIDSSNSKIENIDSKVEYKQIEKVFGVLMVFTACAMAFAHGSNDVANAIGPVAAVVDIVQGGSLASDSMPIWVLFIGASGIVMGLMIWGYRIIMTVGSQITALTPSRAFAAELSASATVVLASAIGMPISTTQTLVGAIFGVGLAGGVNALNLRVVRNIFVSWFITLPMGAGMAIVFFYLLRGLFTLLKVYW